MTNAAVIQRGNMIGGRTLCNNTIVAGGAANAVYVHMVEGDTGEGVKDIRAVT